MLCKEDETPVAPASLYGKCKSIAWQAVLTASQHYGFSAAWGRVFLPYGPGDSPRRLIPSVLASLRAGRPIQTTEGYQQRDFVFAPDVANMFIRLLGNEEAGVFNIGTGEATKIRTVVELLAERFGARNLLQLGARPVALEDPMHLVADMSKTRRALGELPLTSLAVGLEQVCHEFETQA
jgi:nucleoside-diphosphate-sugar epimerase